MFRLALFCAGLLALLPPAGQAAGRPRFYIEDSRSWTWNGWSPLTGLPGAFSGGDGPKPSPAAS